MNNKINTNHPPNYEKPYPLVREILKKKMDKKRNGNSYEQVNRDNPKHLKKELNVEQNQSNGKPAKRKESDASLNRREERPGTSRTSARHEPSCGGNNQTIATQTSRRKLISSKIQKQTPDKKISTNYLPNYEKPYPLIRELLKKKLDKKINTNYLPNYEKPYPIIRELLKEKMDKKSLGNGSQEQVNGASIKHLYKTSSNVEHYNRNGKPAKRKETDANFSRRDERPGTSPTSARISSSSGCKTKTNKKIATQTSHKPNNSDESEVKKRPDNKNQINPDQLQQYEKIFLKSPLIKEGFKTKLDRKKLEAFAIWFKCVEHQFMRGTIQDEKRKSIIKKFCKKDDVFGLNMLNRNRVVQSGMSKVKEVAFGAFESEFAEFVNSAEYYNTCKYCGIFY